MLSQPQVYQRRIRTASALEDVDVICEGVRVTFLLLPAFSALDALEATGLEGFCALE